MANNLSQLSELVNLSTFLLQIIDKSKKFYMAKVPSGEISMKSVLVELQCLVHSVMSMIQAHGHKIYQACDKMKRL